MIVVADTSPINYLILIHEIEVLPKLYGTVIVPPSVRQELGRDGAPEIVRKWIARPPNWLSVRTPTIVPDAELIAAEINIAIVRFFLWMVPVFSQLLRR